MNIHELRKIGKDNLILNNIEDAQTKNEILLQFVLKMSKVELVINSDKSLEENKVCEFLTYIDQIIKGKPVQYITNEQEFMKLKFYVDENVLIPQPDTEILVEETINQINELVREKQNIKVLDLCTGSGAIAISIKRYTKESGKNVDVFASDISEKALEVARKNALNNNEKINFINSDMFENIEEKNFDIIVSNPPYIEKEMIKSLSKEVQKEPILALDGGKDGLEFYKIIVKDGYKHLSVNGRILVEIGYNQKKNVMNLFEETKKYYGIKCTKDLSNNDRVISARYNKEYQI